MRQCDTAFHKYIEMTTLPLLGLRKYIIQGDKVTAMVDQSTVIHVPGIRENGARFSS